MKNRVQIRSEIYDPIAEYSDINKAQQSNLPESGSDPSDHSQNRSYSSVSVPENPDNNSPLGTSEEHKSPHKNRKEGSSISISQKTTVKASDRCNTYS